MRHQDFSRYYQLSLRDKVEPWKCINSSHQELILLPKHDFETRKTILLCLYPGCEYKITPGIDFYEKMISILEEVDDE